MKHKKSDTLNMVACNLSTATNMGIALRNIFPVIKPINKVAEVAQLALYVWEFREYKNDEKFVDKIVEAVES